MLAANTEKEVEVEPRIAGGLILEARDGLWLPLRRLLVGHRLPDARTTISIQEA